MSNTGTWMQRVAQDWLVLELAAGSGATALGITTGLQFLPFLLLTPFAGLVADRMPKHRLLQLTNIGMALPAGVLGVLAVTGHAEVWHVYVLAFLVGSALAFGATVVLAGLMPTYLTFALLAPVTGLTALTFITSANTYMQLHTDAGVRGRVMALYLMIFMGGTPVGAPIIGWIGEEYGARWTLLGGGLLTIAGVALSATAYLRLERRRRERVIPVDERVPAVAPAAF